MNDQLGKGLSSYVSSSLSSSTWASYSSGWKNFEKFEVYTGKTFQFPLNSESVRAYVIWSLNVRKLRVSTVKLYLSSLKMAHTLLGCSSEGWKDDKLLELILTGAENLEPPSPGIRRAMTMDLLLILGHRIASSDWNKVSKQVVWTACTVSFFSSVRLGEILAVQRKKFDRFSTLLWENVMFLDKNEAVLFIPSTKTSAKGEFLDLFPLEGHPCCPVAALKKLLLMQKTIAVAKWSKAMPVFTFSSGSFLTVDCFNDLLKVLLVGVCKEGAESISAHSFRAAVPSAISAWPEKFHTSEVKDWSRWRGSSFLLYCRSYRDQRRKLFKKIVTVLK
jgi:hypothetical protein